MNFKKVTDYQKFSSSGKKPSDIPSNPQQIYKNKGWISWDNFLGTEIKDYLEAKKIVKKLKFSNNKEFTKYLRTKGLSGIPKNPEHFYKRRNKWKGWPDFLGKK